MPKPGHCRRPSGTYSAISTEETTTCTPVTSSTLAVPWVAEDAERNAAKLAMRYTREQRSVISHLTRALSAMTRRVDHCREDNQRLQRQLEIIRETNALVSDADKSHKLYNGPVPLSPLVSPIITRHSPPRLSSEGESDTDSLELDSRSGCSSSDDSSDSGTCTPTCKTRDADNLPTLYKQSQSLGEKNDVESRKANLIFYGIDEEDDEGRCDCFFKVRDFVWDHLGIGDNKGGKIVSIQFAHRLGDEKHRSKPRPILVKFADLKQRAEILRRARQMLRGSRVRITEEYSATTQEVCRQLVRYLNFRRTRHDVSSTGSMIHQASLSSDSDDERETFI